MSGSHSPGTPGEFGDLPLPSDHHEFTSICTFPPCGCVLSLLHAACFTASRQEAALQASLWVRVDLLYSWYNSGHGRLAPRPWGTSSLLAQELTGQGSPEN